MARMTIGKAIVSDDGQWYHTGWRWKPFADEADKKPGFGETAKAAEMSTLETGGAAKRLVALVDEHGSVAAAEEALGFDPASVLPPRETQRVVTYKNRAAFERASKAMFAEGWRIQGQDKDADATTAGRVGGGALLGSAVMPGLGTLVGGAMGAASKKRGEVQVVWERD